MKIVQFAPKEAQSPMPPDFVPHLRELIARIESGEITCCIVMACTKENRHESFIPANQIAQSLLLSTVLHKRVLEHFK